MNHKEPYILIIGGSNIDIFGQSHQPLTYHESNLGQIHMALGGVGRNIAENCARLNLNTYFISALGDDFYGQEVLKHAQSIQLNMEHSLIVKRANTATYLSILDHDKDLLLGINDMAILDLLDVSFLESKAVLIENAQLCVLDTNLSQEVLDYCLNNFKSVPFFVDGVSAIKVLKIKNHLDKIHTLKINHHEAQALLDDPKLDFLNQSLAFTSKRTIITHGAYGAYWMETNHIKHYPTKALPLVNATGAGDAFMAALVYAYVHDYNQDLSMHLAQSSAAINLSSSHSIHPDFNEDSLLKTLKENYDV